MQLTDSSGNVLASTLIYGVGLGPQITFGAGAQAVLDTDLSDPYNLAVDGNSNIFVADTLNARVMKIPAGGGTPTSLVSGLSFPTGVAVNGAGDVLIVDNARSLLVEVPAGGGSPINVPIQVTSPIGAAVDGAGNVFISSYNAQSVAELPAAGGAEVQVATLGYRTLWAWRSMAPAISSSRIPATIGCWKSRRVAARRLR